MGRTAELTGIVKPDVDEAAVERQAGRVSDALSRTVKFAPKVAKRRLQRQIEGALPGGKLLGSMFDAARSGGGGGGGPASGDSSVELEKQQVELLEDIQNELEKIGSSGGLTGGGGGGGRLPMVLKSGGSAGAGGFLGSILGGGTAAMAGAGGIGAALGLAGVKGMQMLGVQKKVGDFAGSLGNQDMIKKALQVGGTLSPGLPAMAGIGAFSNQAVKGNFGKGLSDAKEAMKRTTYADEAIEGLADPPDWLTNLDLVPGKPDWLADVDLSPELPDWIAEVNLSPELPDWIPKVDLKPEYPDWIPTVDLKPEYPDWIDKFEWPRPKWLSKLSGFKKQNTTMGSEGPVAPNDIYQAPDFERYNSYKESAEPTATKDATGSGDGANVTVSMGGMTVNADNEANVEKAVTEEIEKRKQEIAAQAAKEVEKDMGVRF